jgi:hypothetical protein
MVNENHENRTMSMGLRGAILLLGSMLMTARGHASPAADEGPILVFESYGGRRPANVDRFMGPLREQLERHGFAARPETIEQLIGCHLPRPGILDKGVTTAAILDLVNTAYDAFSRALFDVAASKLTEAIDKIRRNSALLVLDTGNQEVIYKAHVGLALSQARLGLDEQATATMGELVRMFRIQLLSRSEHGPTAEQFARKVYKQVSSLGRGRLRIKTGHSNAMIFVDYQLRGMGEVGLDDLIPGVYRVLVQEPQTAGLAYAVEVPESGDVELDVSWEVDTALVVSPQWIGFEFSSEAERRHEAVYGRSVAQRCSRRKFFAVVGTTKFQGRPALIGTLHLTATGQVLRSAVIVLEDALADADDATLGALAKFLADGTPGTGIDIVAGEGAGVAAAAPARERRHRSTLPAKLLIAGGAAAAIAGGVLYAYDEDENPVGQQKPTYIDSARHGVAIGVAGVTALGIGVWLWTRTGHSRAVPVATFARSAGMVGLACRF